MPSSEQPSSQTPSSNTPSSTPSASPSAAPTPGESPELIWLRPERTGRGPRPAHSRTSIAAAAIVIADAEGLDAVSMRRVAAALGAGTMSLYNYVPKKEHLLDLMLDAVAGEYDYSGLTPTGDCRADLRRLAYEQLAALRRHPWVPTLVIARPGLGPNALRYTEHFLAVTEPSGLDGTARLEALALLTGFVCQFAQYERTAAAGAKWQADLAGYLGRAAASGEFPHLAAAFATTGAAADSPDAVFDRSLDRVITAALAPVGTA
ncbi:TetR/AcrR family transcriptional regulator C-terminal domain-containing protein [Kitasatospora sp. MBT66]|uniref:TetR/AcrR family transcriptional regulator C-terminal domain-containing protein n=1 Tax=Kitasatospora sp. MBT66 TaxID=1444769 RepID=UPI000B03C419